MGDLNLSLSESNSRTDADTEIGVRSKPDRRPVRLPELNAYAREREGAANMPKTRRADLKPFMVDGELVIYDRASGLVHQLNATASHIWTACDGGQAVEEIAASVAASFAGSPLETVLTDVIRTLAELERLGLVEDRPA